MKWNKFLETFLSNFIAGMILASSLIFFVGCGICLVTFLLNGMIWQAGLTLLILVIAVSGLAALEGNS